MDWTDHFDERQFNLIQNCRLYAANEPAGLPGHALMVIVATMADILDMQRVFRLVANENGDWYAIPPAKTDLFYSLVDELSNGANYERFVEEFSRYYIDGSIEDYLVTGIGRG